jgi:hypothetical protein
VGDDRPGLNGQLSAGKTKVIEEFIAASAEAVRELRTRHRLAHILTWVPRVIWPETARACNQPTTITNDQAQMTRTKDQGSLAIWSEWRDSNPRPLVPQTSALTGLRYTPIPALIEKALLRRNAPCEAGRSQ